MKRVTYAALNDFKSLTPVLRSISLELRSSAGAAEPVVQERICLPLLLQLVRLKGSSFTSFVSSQTGSRPLLTYLAN